MGSRSRLHQKHSTEVNIVFEGLIQSSLRAKLTIELLKYLAHQRGQIPLSYELVKRDYDRDLQEHAEQNAPKSRKAGRTKLEALKRKKTMTALEKIFESLEEVFSRIDPIPEVLISLGATLVSPKEVYRLRFPTKCYDGKVLNWTSCRMALFQNLVSADVFGTAKPCKPGTKITVLLQASRDSAASVIGLTAKPAYKISHRGEEYIFNFVCRGREINPEISHLDASLNISGIEPFDHDSPVASVGGPLPPVLPNATPVSVPKRKSFGKIFPGLQRKLSRLDSVEENPDSDNARPSDKDITTSPDNMELELNIEDIVSKGDALTLEDEKGSDLMWFQIPVSVTGFRDRTSRLT